MFQGEGISQFEGEMRKVTTMFLLVDFCAPHAHFTIWWSHSVSVRGLPLCGGTAVAPRSFHLTITALTIDWVQC